MGVVADRIQLRAGDRKRVLDSIETAYRFGGGRLDVRIPPDHHLAFSRGLECAACGIRYRPPLPNLFSFNSPVGACETCRGFGRVIAIDMDLVIPDAALSIDDGAIKPWGGRAEGRFEYKELADFCRQHGIPTDIPFQDLDEGQRRAVKEGTDGYYGVRGFFEWLETKTYKMPVRVFFVTLPQLQSVPGLRRHPLYPRSAAVPAGKPPYCGNLRHERGPKPPVFSRPCRFLPGTRPAAWCWKRSKAGCVTSTTWGCPT